MEFYHHIVERNTSERTTDGHLKVHRRMILCNLETDPKKETPTKSQSQWNNLLRQLNDYEELGKEVGRCTEAGLAVCSALVETRKHMESVG